MAPNTETPTPPLPPLVEPGRPDGWWEDDDRECARIDRASFDRDED